MGEFLLGNGVKQGVFSLRFYNVKHMLYADDIEIFAPYAKGLHKLLDMCFNYGCSHAIQFNPLKSVVTYIDYRKRVAARSSN